jgi:hypothetical protein
MLEWDRRVDILYVIERTEYSELEVLRLYIWRRWWWRVCEYIKHILQSKSALKVIQSIESNKKLSNANDWSKLI